MARNVWFTRPTWLEFRLSAPMQSYRVTVASEQFDRRRRRYPTITLLPGGDPFEYELAAFGEYGDGGDAVVWYQRMLPNAPFVDDSGQFDQVGHSNAEVARRGQVSGLLVETVFEEDLYLELGNLSAPLEALDNCTIDLMNHIGIAWNGVASWPEIANRGEWERPIIERYPRRMLDSGIEGRVVLRIIVEADGRPSDCAVQEPVVDDDYQEFVCSVLLENAEYEPARNEAGQAVRGITFQNIVYFISQRETPGFLLGN